MALPKTELLRGRFTLTAMFRDIEGKLRELFAPLDLKPPKRKDSGYKGAPGPIEWNEGVAPKKSVVGAGFEEVEVCVRKFPEKRIEMEPKRMHKPKVRKPKIKREKARGKLQKNL